MSSTLVSSFGSYPLHLVARLLNARMTQPLSVVVFYNSFQSCVSALSGTFSLWQRVRTSFQNILFLTDGTCGGACSLLLSKLQVEGRARVASFGGIVGQRMDTSFAGGYIENWPEEFEKVWALPHSVVDCLKRNLLASL